MKDFLDNFAAVIGAATLALLLFAVCHEYGYFSVIGSSFQSFVSTTDYFTNATQWFLMTGFSLYTWLDWKSLFGTKIYMQPLSKDWRTWLFPSVMLLLFLLDWFFSAQPSVQFFFLFLYVWLVYVAKYIIPFADATEPMKKNIRSAIIAVPVLAVFAFSFGQQKGLSSLYAISDPYTIKMKTETRQRVLLRNFDKGLLVRNPVDQRVEFIKWDQIEEVTKPSPKYPYESYACKWLEWWCRLPSMSP
ncbi:hypothetical protein [Bradyrhizobium sp. BWC-3-1]|uniref:hypothetical protein n=1 Tax=Bradyrhizobium sp. BWC-3-1 TaxID=3080012 RepID=UPI00293EB7D7|nr:hypothetical protein [Bradyrhizobium sp. BWC-3-1]WOH60929.1 hypothetical protein RX329_12825 [Bradyrhizobium sp. BWC-3-1]